MKKILLILLSIFLLCSCTADVEVTTGGIYGVVSYSNSAEPVKGVGVELYILYDRNDLTYKGDLLLRTTTSDDGSFSFENLNVGSYLLQVVNDGCETASYEVTVEAGRTARADMQLVQLQDIGLKIVTENAQNYGYVILGGRFQYIDDDCAPIEFGVLYSKNSNPKNDGTRVVGRRLYAGYMPDWTYFDCVTIGYSQLSEGKYYFQAYATNKYGTIYGNVLSFEVK